MRRFGCMMLRVFGFSTILLGALLTMLRRDPISTDWATLIEAVQVPSGYSFHLTLFHPETGYQRELAYIDINASPDAIRWSPDGQWLLIAVQTVSSTPSLYRIHWSGRHFTSIPQVQRSFALRATEWSPDGEWGVLLETRQYRGDLLWISADGAILKTLLSDIPFFIVGPHIRWSPDGQWIWAALAVSDTETAVFRIDAKTLAIEILPPLMGTLDALEISPDGEWIVYSIRQNFGDPLISVYQSRPDGSDTQLLARIQLKFIPDLWWTEQGDLMAVVEELAGTNYFIGRIDPIQQTIVPVVSDLPIASRLQWSHDHRFMATETLIEGSAYILIMTADGRQQWQYPAEEFCMFVDPRWSADDKWLMFLRRRTPDQGVCEFHRVRPGSDDVQPVLASDLTDYDVDTAAAGHPDWLSTLYFPNRGSQNVFPTLIHQQTGDIVPLPNGRVMAWSNVPIQTEDSRLVIVMGIVMLCVTLISNWLFSRKS